jgi:hypothetical protein
MICGVIVNEDLNIDFFFEVVEYRSLTFNLFKMHKAYYNL